MSNGPPPFPPPGMGMPPFRPKFAPGSAPLPPFPPPGFSPNNGPGGPGGASPAGYGPRHGRGPGGQGPGGHGGYPPPGSGLPPMPSGFPTPPHQSRAVPNNNNSNNSGPRKDVKTTKIFIGGIAPGITDHILRDLLNACGPLHELKRVEGANGQPQSFAFAMFESPEVVLRCIRCLNGVELPDISPEGKREGNRKPLIVKADQKTAEFLKEFEDTLGRSESDEKADEASRKSIEHIVGRLIENVQQSQERKRGGRNSPIHVHVPAHLQDLKEGDLPETQRVAVLDQIAIFRENAARRERDKKNLDEERERFKTMQARGQPVGYGYGTRAFPKSEVPKGEPSHGRGSKDPQGYDKPVNFVKPETAEGKAESERTDDEDEAMRQQRRDRDRASALREREHRVEKHERQRIDSVMREESVRRQRIENETRNRRIVTDDLEHWDDDELEERGKEFFYSDRQEWRRQRQQQRAREDDDDVEDRRMEDAEHKALEAESEDFLKQQAAELASMEEQQRKKGLLTEDAGPVKLNISAAKLPVPEPKEEKPAPVAKPAVTLGDDEEDEASAARKKRTFVKLNYEQIQAEAGIPDEAEVAKTKARLLDISRQLPTSTRSIFGGRIDWSAVKAVQPKIREFVGRTITSALGELDADLAAFVMEHLAERKGPEDLVDDLNPVLAEEAESFVVSLWRQLIFESKAASQAVDTGSTTV